jgi:hypothetical protein
MARQYFPDLANDPPLVTPTALVSTSIEDLWPAAQWTPINANEARPGKVYSVRAGGIWSTGASGTLIISPLINTVTLGASQTQTVPVSMSNVPWRIEGELVIRTIGVAGTNSTAIFVGHFLSSGLTSNATPGSSLALGFGGTSASFDATIAGNLQIRKTLSVAGSFSTQYAFLQSIS